MRVSPAPSQQQNTFDIQDANEVVVLTLPHASTVSHSQKPEKKPYDDLVIKSFAREIMGIKQYSVNLGYTLAITFVPIILAILAVVLIPLQTPPSKHSIAGNSVYMVVFCPLIVVLGSSPLVVLFHNCFGNRTPTVLDFLLVAPVVFPLFSAWEIIIYEAYGTLMPCNLAFSAVAVIISSFIASYWRFPKETRPKGRELFKIVATAAIVTLCFYAVILYVIGFAYCEYSFWLQNFLVLVYTVGMYLFKQLTLKGSLIRNDAQGALLIPGWFLECCSELMMIFVFPNMGNMATMVLYVLLQLIPDMLYPIFFTRWFFEFRIKIRKTNKIFDYFFSEMNATEIEQHRKKAALLLFFDILVHFVSGISYLVISVLLYYSWNSDFYPYRYYGNKYWQSLYSAALLVGISSILLVGLQFLLLRVFCVNMVKGGLECIRLYPLSFATAEMEALVQALSVMTYQAQVWFWLDPNGLLQTDF